MMLHFNEKKTTQAAGHLLGMAGGKMNFVKLLKLLYLADRKALIEWGRPITFDRFVSMDKGPVLSQTYNTINEGPDPEIESYWHNHISAPEKYEVSLIDKTPPIEKLSEAELALLEELYLQYEDKNQWQIIAECHKLPEWEDPKGSSIPIEIRRILEVSGKPNDEIELILDELEHIDSVDRMISRND